MGSNNNFEMVDHSVLWHCSSHPPQHKKVKKIIVAEGQWFPLVLLTERRTQPHRLDVITDSRHSLCREHQFNKYENLILFQTTVWDHEYKGGLEMKFKEVCHSVFNLFAIFHIGQLKMMSLTQNCGSAPSAAGWILSLDRLYCNVLICWSNDKFWASTLP